MVLKEQCGYLNPILAESVFEDYIKEFKIKTFRNEWLNRSSGIQKIIANIEFSFASGKVFKGPLHFFIIPMKEI